MLRLIFNLKYSVQMLTDESNNCLSVLLSMNVQPETNEINLFVVLEKKKRFNCETPKIFIYYDFHVVQQKF